MAVLVPRSDIFSGDHIAEAENLHPAISVAEVPFRESHQPLTCCTRTDFGDVSLAWQHRHRFFVQPCSPSIAEDNSIGPWW